MRPAGKCAEQPIPCSLFQGGAEQKQQQLDRRFGDVDAVLEVEPTCLQQLSLPGQSVALEVRFAKRQFVVKM